MRKIIIEKIILSEKKILELPNEFEDDDELPLTGFFEFNRILFENFDEFKKKRHFMYSPKVNWDYLCKCQKLNEKFIYEFQEKIEWYMISRR